MKLRVARKVLNNVIYGKRDWILFYRLATLKRAIGRQKPGIAKLI